MSGYFNDFKTMMQRVKAFGAPVMILLEADGYAFIEQQCMDNPSLYAAVKDSGVPELAGLPNTVAGWGSRVSRDQESRGGEQRASRLALVGLVHGSRCRQRLSHRAAPRRSRRGLPGSSASSASARTAPASPTTSWSPTPAIATLIFTSSPRPIPTTGGT